MNVRPVLRVLDAIGARYALIGGHAMAARGYVRSTVDIDILTTDVRVLEHSRWSDLERAGALVERRRGDEDDPLGGVVHVLLADGTDVDVVIGRHEWESALVARAEPIEIATGVTIAVPRIGDLILLKLAAGGPLDVADAAALLALGDQDAVVAYVDSHIGEVRPPVLDAWRELRRRSE